MDMLRGPGGFTIFIIGIKHNHDFASPRQELEQGKLPRSSKYLWLGAFPAAWSEFRSHSEEQAEGFWSCPYVPEPGIPPNRASYY